MKFTPKNPPRRYQVGVHRQIEISDCGKVELVSDEQVTFVTESGAEYDVTRKDWGYYATPSLNGRLEGFGLRGVLIRNMNTGRYFVLLLERGKEPQFDDYMKVEALEVIAWLDESEALDGLAAIVQKAL